MPPPKPTNEPYRLISMLTIIRSKEVSISRCIKVGAKYIDD
ncbi:MAG: hypothetical protein WC121_05030 [Candidatus Kapaibacterium sp.]